MATITQKDELSLVLCGAAGQGLNTVEKILTTTFCQCGYEVFSCKEFMSRIRGGMNSVEMRISNRRYSCYVNRIDILIPLEQGAIEHVLKRLSEKSTIIGNEDTNTQRYGHIDVPFGDLTKNIGAPIYKNSVIVGFTASLLNLDKAILSEVVRKVFNSKTDDVIEHNLQAINIGYNHALSFRESFNTKSGFTLQSKQNHSKIINGAESVALGALAGGCNFIAAYPMSPSTAVVTYLASYAHNFPLIAEQAEDEIAAINMGLGAWYAGARALVSTSGGGFALMTEGVSLAGMIESPVVIHVAQRPGPATGLPTRTEQGDLNLVLYAGHGEFPRIILAPGSAEQGFELTRKAFNLADKYQVPVFVLTDQYFIDASFSIDSLDIASSKIESTIVKTTAGYKRYELSENPISPRGIPGFGDGIVCVDGDEHTEAGYITESMSIRVAMVDKRLAKETLIQENSIGPVLYGDNPEIILLCWGSNLHSVNEALSIIGVDKAQVMHLPQMYPLPREAVAILETAKQVFVIENNATGQLANLIRLKTNCIVTQKINKYDGIAFAVEELVELIGKYL